ncbi:MAG TPA: GNAT family N-acetyltransferase [Steroidobacteraceae bacterium]|nr:GNAT family N-acetyltransferase [Steroidobacteraceae bacterium]
MGPAVGNEAVVLSGRHVRLEPLARTHVPGLVAAAAEDPGLYRWTPLPLDIDGMTRYVDTAVRWREQGTALPFATLRRDGKVIGSTRFFLIERWDWPAGHAAADREGPDACEIGYTWLAASAVRTAANTEAKVLMLEHAFERWRVHRVCFHTDMRNERSRAALARIGAVFEGTLRAHRLASDLIPRDSARFSIIAREWPGVRQRLEQRLAA